VASDVWAPPKVLGETGSAAETMSRPVLVLRDVAVRYPDAPAPSLLPVNLEVRAGECVLVLGPSGCGKSTLALACAGLIPSSVEAELAGEIWRDDALSAPGSVAMVFQDPETQFCMLQVDDEIAFGLENRSMPREQMPERIVQALRTTRLQVPVQALHATFSGGMKQKLAIAAALATDAKLLILDEPTANLDPLSTRQVFETIRALKAGGQTMLVIEHKFDFLLPVADKVVLFGADGQVHRVGPTTAVVAVEWAWMVEQGIVPAWKENPFATLPDADGPDAETAVPPTTPRRLHTPRLATASGNPPVLGVANQPATRVGAVIAVEDAALSYSGNEVWRDVSFALPESAFVAVVGPNGSGKSSLLQALAGMQPTSHGRILLNGQSVREWKAKDRFNKLAFCFQNPEYQFVFERVGDELANRVVGDDVPVEVHAALAEFGLDGTEQQSPYGLSQGQKRRLSVASMLRSEHDIYILDEPTFGQDARTQETIMERLERLQQVGKTVIMSTHDMDLVRSYATHVVVLAEGRLSFFGETEALFKQPQILGRAHLLDDVSSACGVRDATKREPPTVEVGTPVLGLEQHGVQRKQAAGEHQARHRRSPAEQLNPGLHLGVVLVAAVIAIFAQTLPAAIAVCCFPIFLAFTVGWLSPWQLSKRLSVFIVFYILYIWSFVAFSAVPPGAAHVHLLWWNLSWIGLHNGLVLAFRMLGVVSFGILLITSTDMTDLLVSLCQNFRVPPMLSYGVLAGMRFIPMFQVEWRKLHQARIIRGRDARWAAFRPVTYALPLFSQAIRLSERVAIAMEARGFVAGAARHWNQRTYFRRVAIRWWDIAYATLTLALMIALVVWGNAR